MTSTAAYTLTVRDHVVRVTRLEGSDKATAANAALWAGHEAHAVAREAWDAVRAAGSAPLAPIDDATPFEAAARRNANRVRKAADMLYGVASASACGLWLVDDAGRVGVVEATTSGDDYLDGVKFAPLAGAWAVEFPLSDVVAFLDTVEQAVEVADALNP